MVSLTITAGNRPDAYHVHHAADSCQVRWDHDDDSHRTYTVTCSAATGEPTACTCPARAYRVGECRHMAATRVLARRGELTLPRLTDAGHDRETCE